MEDLTLSREDRKSKLGIGEGRGLATGGLPQAFPAILPALSSQYLNLAKNAPWRCVGYADLYAVSDTAITQTGRAIRGFDLAVGFFCSTC